LGLQRGSDRFYEGCGMPYARFHETSELPVIRPERRVPQNRASLRDGGQLSQYTAAISRRFSRDQKNCRPALSQVAVEMRDAAL